MWPTIPSGDSALFYNDLFGLMLAFNSNRNKGTVLLLKNEKFLHDMAGCVDVNVKSNSS